MKWLHKVQDQNDHGFTLLEVMIAIFIFGILLTFTSQFMRIEINQYNEGVRQNAIEQKARTAMMHILDEIRVHAYTQYNQGQVQGQTSIDSGIYYYDDQGQLNCLIDVAPDPNVLAQATSGASNYLTGLPQGTVIYWDSRAGENKLYYRDNSKRMTYLISDDIKSVSIQPMEVHANSPHFVRIDIQAEHVEPGKPTHSYELLTMVRLY